LIALSPLPLAEIRVHGGEAYPEECCGALLGVEEEGEPHVTRTARIPNSRREERRHRFLIAPEEYRRVEALATAEGLLLLGFYHSHPDHSAVPSEYDREQALPFFHYLVLAVASGHPGDLTAWRLSEDRAVFGREELVIQTFQG